MTDGFDDLERLRGQLSGGVPRSLDSWLVRPQTGVPYHQGSVVPILGVPVHERPDGLLVVGESGRQPAPADQMGVYLTASEVFGSGFTPRELAWLLDGVSAKEVVWGCAMMLAAHHHTTDPATLDRQLVGEVLLEDARDRALNLLRRKNWRFLVPQLALLASAGAILELDWDSRARSDHPSPDIATAAILHLHMGDLALRPDEPDDDVLFGNVRGDLTLEVTANHIHSAGAQLGSDIARHERLWHHLAQQVAAERGLPDISSAFERGTGNPIEVFEAVGFGFYTARENAPLVPKSWFTPTAITEEQVERVLAHTSYSVENLRERLRHDLEGDISVNRWRLDAFSERPILDFDEQSWLVHSPQLLVDRFFSGLAFFDADSASHPGGENVRQAWAFVTEAYGHEVLESLAPEAAGQRVYREREIQDAYGTENQRNVDAVMDYGDAWVVLDFSSRRPAREVAQAKHVSHLEKEIDQLITDKADQLHATFTALSGDESRLADRPAPNARRFYPIIVVHSRWPTNPVTVELARLKADELGVLDDPLIYPIVIITIEELEMVEAVQEAGGPDFATLLRRWHEGPLFRMGLKDHILLVERLQIRRPARLDALFNEATDRMVRTFGFPEEARLQ